LIHLRCGCGNGCDTLVHRSVYELATLGNWDRRICARIAGLVEAGEHRFKLWQDRQGVDLSRQVVTVTVKSL
jgi:hypothetical protein